MRVSDGESVGCYGTADHLPCASAPLVSVVTPFYNTARYLADCIESVLRQTYSNFEYILVDNCSTDNSAEIAGSYVQRDRRIRLIGCTEFVSQVQNYNRALLEISEESRYCKIVEADNYIFPDCLRLMVRAFEQSRKVGLVASYSLMGDKVLGSGYSYPTPILSGRQGARRHLRAQPFDFGSPTTVMYRSSIVRQQRSFYDVCALHADSEKCMEILGHWDFGFVHQVLSFLRTENESISGKVRTFQPHALDRYITVQRYAPVFLDAGEAVSLRTTSKRAYYRVLAKEIIRLRLRDGDFWRYHQRGLKALGETINYPYLALQVGLVLLWMVLNPGRTMALMLDSWKLRMKTKASSSSEGTS